MALAWVWPSPWSRPLWCAAVTFKQRSLRAILMSMVSTYHPDIWRFRTETISTCKLPHINYYNEQTMAYRLYNRIVKRFHTKIIKKLRTTVILSITALMCFILFSKIKINFNRAKSKTQLQRLRRIKEAQFYFISNWIYRLMDARAFEKISFAISAIARSFTCFRITYKALTSCRFTTL